VLVRWSQFRILVSQRASVGKVVPATVSTRSDKHSESPLVGEMVSVCVSHTKVYSVVVKKLVSAWLTCVIVKNGGIILGSKTLVL
jgi:hypothetical protein